MLVWEIGPFSALNIYFAPSVRESYITEFSDCDNYTLRSCTLNISAPMKT